MVSLKLDNNLVLSLKFEIGCIERDSIELFGIQEADLIDIIANAPAKVTAFISTIIEIAQHYNLGYTLSG